MKPSAGQTITGWELTSSESWRRTWVEVKTLSSWEQGTELMVLDMVEEHKLVPVDKSQLWVNEVNQENI